MSLYTRLTEQAEREATDLRRRAGPLVLDRNRPKGWALTRGHGHYAASEETWVVTASIEALLRLGHEPASMFVELTIDGRSRPDLVVVSDSIVIVIEAKRQRPTNANRLQVRRYMDAAGRRWDRHVQAFLVWPADRQRPWPYVESDLMLEAVL